MKSDKILSLQKKNLIVMKKTIIISGVILLIGVFLFAVYKKVGTPVNDGIGNTGTDQRRSTVSDAPIIADYMPSDSQIMNYLLKQGMILAPTRRGQSAQIAVERNRILALNLPESAYL